MHQASAHKFGASTSESVGATFPVYPEVHPVCNLCKPDAPGKLLAVTADWYGGCPICVWNTGAAQACTI